MADYNEETYFQRIKGYIRGQKRDSLGNITKSGKRVKGYERLIKKKYKLITTTYASVLKTKQPFSKTGYFKTEKEAREHIKEFHEGLEQEVKKKSTNYEEINSSVKNFIRGEWRSV